MSALSSIMPMTRGSLNSQDSYIQSPNLQGEECVGTNSIDADTGSHILHQLCKDLAIEPQDLLRFESTSPHGVRGVYLNRAVIGGDTILKIPLTSCFVDDQPPTWLIEAATDDPSRWATRLAACWLDLYLQNSELQKQRGNDAGSVHSGSHSLWLSMLPDPESLSASLPVHWKESTVRNARSTALECAVDSAFFTRAEAVEDILLSLSSTPFIEAAGGNSNIRRLCHHALDLVQTRSCRLEEDDSVRRILAPVFDFINHGPRLSSSTSGSGSAANAYFEVETEVHGNGDDLQKFLVVRALKDLDENKEVLIDYGFCARPAWKCLLSYGFVPQYAGIASNDDDGENDDDVAEVYMMGVRYEVTADTIPVEMVAAAAACERDELISSQSNESEEDDSVVVLTPKIAKRIARRISETAYHLLLEPDELHDKVEEDYPSSSPTHLQLISEKLAASLRWSQHRVLLSCADGLGGYAIERAASSLSASSSSPDSSGTNRASQRTDLT